MGSTSDEHLVRVRGVCRSLESVTEKLSHGEPTFFVGGKVFVMFANNHHGDGHIAVWVPVPRGVRDGLVERSPGTFFIPPYVGVRGWVGIELAQISDDDLRFYVETAWELIAPRRLFAMG